MKQLKPMPKKRPDKKSRQHQVLLALIDLYIKTGKAIGSNTLREAEFKTISSATIRNYFMNLEAEGYLMQEHSSAGRIPTSTAYQLYANEFYDTSTVPDSEKLAFEYLRHGGNREITGFLQQAAEFLSKRTKLAVFLSAPRFDHDFIIDLKLVAIDQNRCLCILITDFGLIKTEVLHTEKKLNSFALKRIESYFHWRLTRQDKPSNIDEEELNLAQKFYNEVIIRYIVGYSNFSDEDLYWTGFSELLQYHEFNDAIALAGGLALFENTNSLRHLLRECSSADTVKYLIGEQLESYSKEGKHCTVITTPYHINQRSVGAIGILGPKRIPYKQLFATLRLFSTYISEALTKDIFKYKISYREAEHGSLYLEKEEKNIIQQSDPMLLEDKSQ